MANAVNRIFITGELNDFSYEEAKEIIKKSNNIVTKNISEANIVIIGENFNEQLITEFNIKKCTKQIPLFVAEDFLHELIETSYSNSLSKQESVVALKIHSLIKSSKSSQAVAILNAVKEKILTGNNQVEATK